LLEAAGFGTAIFFAGRDRCCIANVIYIITNIAAPPGATINVASFSRSGNVFSARARTTNLSVKPGLNIFAVDDNEFEPFAIHNGDYLGVYLNNSATLEVYTGSTGWTVNGDQTASASVDFGSPDVGPVSLYAELFDDDGVFQTCEENWINWYNDETRGGGAYQGFNRDWQYDENAIYVEDNTITYWGNHVNTNWGATARMVVRHNRLYSVRGVTTWAKPGSNFFLLHDNYYEFIGWEGQAPPAGYCMWLNIDSLVYNNTYKNFGSVATYEAYRNYSDYYFPFYVRAKEIYTWNNTYEDMPCGDNDEACWNTANEGTYFMNQPGDNGSVHFRAPLPGERLYGFTEYPYPHPLTTVCPEGQSCEEQSGYICDNVDYVCNATSIPACEEYCCSEPCSLEQIPPARSNGLPATAQLSGTTEVTLNLTTNENSTCKYSTTSGTNYASMPNSFSNTGETNHSTQVTGLSDSNTYSYYVKCSDTKGNSNTDDFVISFKVNAPDLTPPVMMNIQNEPAAISAIVTLQTDELTTITILDGSNIIGSDNTENTEHSINILDLAPTTGYAFTIVATDRSENTSYEEIQLTTTEVFGWLTPSSVNSACSTSSAGNLIDEDTGNNFQHWFTENHWVVLDMESSHIISKIRMYHIQYSFSAGITAIYVSENTTDWGESLGSLPAPASNDSGWIEINITTKKGRYIKIVSESVKSPYWTEFDAYVDSAWIAPPRGLKIISGD